jgi:superfamily II DNA or RNA helicase
MMKLIDNEKLKYDSGKGDFTERSQFEAFNELRIYTGMINAYNQKALGKKTIVFCPNIEMSEIVAKQFESVLDNVFCLTSKNTKEERKQILSDYHASSDGIMVNCGILTTGYDHPQIECVILFRATTSLPLFFQMVGRGSRPSKGKDLLTVIDLGENCERIGLWSDSKDWTDLFWNPPKKGIPQPAPTKECPKCQSLLPVQVMQCRYCGNQFKSKERELAEGVLIEVKSAVNKKMYDLTVDEMIKLVKSKVLSEHYVARVLRSKRGGYYDLIEYSQKMNKSQGFITYNMSAPKGAKNTVITAEFIQEKLSNV